MGKNQLDDMDGNHVPADAPKRIVNLTVFLVYNEL